MNSESQSRTGGGATKGKTTWRIGAASIVLCLAVGLVGCSGDAGGKTTCGAFLKKGSHEREQIVTQMLQDHGMSTSAGNVFLYTRNASLYCQEVSPNNTIDQILG